MIVLLIFIKGGCLTDYTFDIAHLANHYITLLSAMHEFIARGVFSGARDCVMEVRRNGTVHRRISLPGHLRGSPCSYSSFLVLNEVNNTRCFPVLLPTNLHPADLLLSEHTVYTTSCLLGKAAWVIMTGTFFFFFAIMVSKCLEYNGNSYKYFKLSAKN